MHTRTLFLLLGTLALVGCPKNDDKPKDEKSSTDKTESKDKDKKKKSDDDDDDKGGGDKKKKSDDSKKSGDDGDDDKGASTSKKATGARKIAGVDVPAWAEQAAIKDKCKPSADDQAKLTKLQKGDDATITDGSVDLDALKKDVASDCAQAVPKLAMALNSGGYMHYTKKKYDEADRWWARALVIDPSLEVARYNLACGLALEGKDADAVWTFQQLAAAADDGDAAASNYLDKAKTDKDVDSLRDEAGFTEALTHAQGGLVGPRKEPEIASALPALLPADWKSGTVDDGLGNDVKVTYKPTLVDVWTWRPDKDTELLVGRVVQDPSMAAKISSTPQMQWDVPETWGGIVVMRLGDNKKVELLHAHQLTNNAPYAVAAGKNGSVVYSFLYGPMGGQSVNGTLLWQGGKVVAHDPTVDGA